MSSEGPVVVDSYADSMTSAYPWDVSSGTNGVNVITGSGINPDLDTDTLLCQFDALDFTTPDANYIEVSFDAVTSTDMGGALPTMKQVKTSLDATDVGDDATISSRTYVYLIPVSSVDTSGAWDIELIFTTHGGAGENTSITISNVQANVSTDPITPPDDGGSAEEIAMRSCIANGAQYGG